MTEKLKKLHWSFLMGKLQFHIIHCLDTRAGQFIPKRELEMWHMGPKDLKSGRVKYLGKVYKSRFELPDNEINGISIKHLEGRGWDRLGYSVTIHRDGELEIITPYDNDEWVDNDEMTWGCAGHNSVSRHIALEGGYGAKRNDLFYDHFTTDQYDALYGYLRGEIELHPGVMVAGHNDFTNEKACPGFRVFALMEMYRMTDNAYVG